MLAINSKTAWAILIGSITMGIVSSNAQQTPSQRYQPLNQPAVFQSQQNAHSYPYDPPRSASSQSNPNQVPPSVHLPPQQVRQLSSPSRPMGSGANYNFSDSTESSAAQQNFQAADGSYSTAYDERGTVKQTSYAAEIGPDGEPIVPEILAGEGATTKSSSSPVFQTPRQPAAPGMGITQGNSLPTGPNIVEESIPPKSNDHSPERYANQMQQMRGDAPRIAPQDFSGSNQIQQQFDDLQKQVAARQLEKRTQSELAVSVAQKSATATPPPIATNFPEPGINPARAAANDIPARVTSPFPPVDANGSAESAREFISKLNPQRTESSFVADGQVQTAGGSTAMQDKMPATMHVPTEFDSGGDSSIQQASAQSEISPNATIKLSAPSIAVETYGPQTVGINKSAIYKVVVTNTSNMTADRINVGIDLPAWIDLENINLTAGDKEITDGKQKSRLIWKLDQIPGNGSQTITLTAIPRKAETFDLGIEWSLAPRAGTTNIQVTQPKLEMNIVGPDEVQFGEQALYHVTVRNPGTGAAENVVVMLPEALGGERASLGNIGAGKDKNFQVELLARTAGQLELMTTAVAEGNLEVSANRKLTVRRANLGVSISGPSLKYSGGVGQYAITIVNNGDATANEIIAGMALPTGVQFLGGIESFQLIEGGLKWQVGSLDPGQKREYKVSCQLDASGDLQLEAGAQGKGDLQAASACLTKVETVADLVLSVRDPKGPLPTGQNTIYEITIHNRGSRAANGVNVVMQFSEGIEPKSASGLDHRLVPGQVLFAPIQQIEPGQEISFKVNAEAFKPGTHVFRAQLICEESDSREIAEGTTKFFGDEIRNPDQNTADKNSAAGESQDFSTGVKR